MTMQHLQVNFSYAGPERGNYTFRQNTTGFNTFPEDEPPLLGYDTPEAIVIGIILSMFIFMAIAGNILVCVAIFTDRNLRRTSNYFIVSLAVADLLVAILVMSFAVANDILGYWIFAVQFCSVWISFDIMCSTASILNLCAISLDRYIHIRNPLHYDQWMTPLRTCLFISIVWILSGLISFIPIHLGWHQIGMDNVQSEPSSHSKHYICMLELNPMYAVISSLVSFYMPCLVMILIYFKLFQYARRQVLNIKKTTRFHPSDNDIANKHKHRVSDHKAAVTLGVIMGTFLFCWMPFFTINIVWAFCPDCIPNIIFSVFTWLGYFNSTLNPVIYSIFNKEFREAFKKVLSLQQCSGLKDLEFRRPIRFTHIPQKNAFSSGSVKSMNGHPRSREINCNTPNMASGSPTEVTAL